MICCLRCIWSFTVKHTEINTILYVCMSVWCYRGGVLCNVSVCLSHQDAGSQQVGFLLGSCGVTLALTSDACQKGLPKAQTGEVLTFKGGWLTPASFWITLHLALLYMTCVCFTGWPRLLWFVTDGKHVVKPPKDWHPPIRDASNEIAYIEVRVTLVHLYL